MLSSARDNENKRLKRTATKTKTEKRNNKVMQALLSLS